MYFLIIYNITKKLYTLQNKTFKVNLYKCIKQKDSNNPLIVNQTAVMKLEDKHCNKVEKDLQLKYE